MAFYENYGSNFHLYHQTFPGNMSAMHIHPHFEAFLILDPVEQHIHINGQQIFQDQPTLTVFPPFCLHKTDFSLGEVVERTVFYFGDTMMSAYPPSFEAFIPYKELSACIFLLEPKLVDRLRPIKDLLNQTEHDSREQEMIFLLIFNMILNSGAPNLLCTFENKIHYINEVLKYMTSHLTEGLTAESVAQHFFISRSKLNKDFKKYTTISFHQLLIEMKLSRAIYLLQDGSTNIGTVAAEAGFENECYFYSLFKQKKNTTPLKYAKKYRQRKTPLHPYDDPCNLGHEK